MQSLGSHSPGRPTGSWLGLALCGAVAVAWAVQQLVPNPDAGQALAPEWLPPAAAGIAAVGILPLEGSPGLRRVRRGVRWLGLLLLVWAANGLPFDVLTAAGLIGHRTASGEIVLATVYWPGLATRALALGAAAVVARLALTRSEGPADLPAHPARWYAYAAFVLALPYPVLRLHWALGGTLGLRSIGAAGAGWEPLLIAIPWALAAVLSLFLIRPPRWLPRRLVLAAGWSATAIVGMIGPAALWAFIRALPGGGDAGSGDIELWVFGLFYGSWFLWAIAGGAATWAYQSRSAGPPASSPA